MSAGHSVGIHPDESFKLGKLASWGPKLIIAGILVLLITVGIGFTPSDHFSRFFHSYLLGFTYFLSLALGALFFTILQHLVRAKWSIVVRRLAELLASTFPLLILLSLPILIGMLAGNNSLYHWSDPVLVDPNSESFVHLIYVKRAYLNVPFFVGRVAVYLIGSWLIARWFVKKSIEQDETGNPELSEKMRVASAPAMIAFAFITAFAAFDLLMSLAPEWFSTMWGVYYFAGAVVSIMATLALFGMILQRSGRLTHSITTEHYHDLGKLLFAFVFFWSYVAFSQFMLIWYANLPEETVWFYPRMFTSWKWLSWFLFFGHCVFPFICLLSRNTKRRRTLLAFFSGWMLLMHYWDLFWIIMPQYGGPHADPYHGFIFNIMDITAVLGIGLLFFGWVLIRGRNVNLLPIKDPRLGESLAFENF